MLTPGPSATIRLSDSSHLRMSLPLLPSDHATLHPGGRFLLLHAYQS